METYSRMVRRVRDSAIVQLTTVGQKQRKGGLYTAHTIRLESIGTPTESELPNYTVCISGQVENRNTAHTHG